MSRLDRLCPARALKPGHEAADTGSGLGRRPAERPAV